MGISPRLDSTLRTVWRLRDPLEFSPAPSPTLAASTMLLSKEKEEEEKEEEKVESPPSSKSPFLLSSTFFLLSSFFFSPGACGGIVSLGAKEGTGMPRKEKEGGKERAAEGRLPALGSRREEKPSVVLRDADCWEPLGAAHSLTR